MAVNPLKVATAGYLKRNTKAVLVIAVAGYLNFGGTPPINNGKILSTNRVEEQGGRKKDFEDKIRARNQKDDEELILFCKAVTQWLSENV